MKAKISLSIFAVVVLATMVLAIDRKIFYNRLMQSISENNIDIAKNVISSRWNMYSLDIRNHDGNTPLCFAIDRETPLSPDGYRIARMLIDEGACPNYQAKSNEKTNLKSYIAYKTPLLCVLLKLDSKKERTEDIAMIQHLLAKGANPNINLIFGGHPSSSPLILATGNGNAEIVKLLLSYNANANYVQICHGDTSIDSRLDALDEIILTPNADDNSRVEIAKALFEHGYDLKKQCSENQKRLSWIKNHIDSISNSYPKFSDYLKTIILKFNLSEKQDPRT